MTSTPVQNDIILWQTLRTRRRREKPLRGLDALANRWLQRARHSRKGVVYLRREAEAADQLDRQFSALTDEQLDDRIGQVCAKFARHQHTAEDVRQALGVVREAAHRQIGQKPYVVQMMGALGMYHGQIVEMVTGEGKTLAAAVAATLLGWLRKPVHIITVNDYLAQRDAGLNNAIYQRCRLAAGAIVGETPEPERASIYRKPIIYTTQKELVADWLRDQLRLGRLAEPVSARWLLQARVRRQQLGQADALVPGLHAVIVDEIDAVLVDEAVTPLIIAQPRGEDPQAALFKRARELTDQLQADRDYVIDRIRRQARLTEQGQRQIESLLEQDEHAIWRAQRRREELIEQALVARCHYREGKHYQIVEDQVMIVDEYTGRYMQDRQWEHGLHQAVEAKHDLAITADRDTLASMSFQQFFRQYPHLCGMTGTAADARAEMETTYGLPVRTIPTHRPVIRKTLADMIFTTTAQKWQAVVDQVKRLHAEGRPVLIATRSIDASELLSGMLNEQDIAHQVLNAVHHEKEAEIVAQAGVPGAITVATNMAGRGTDIELGDGVIERGGLHVILTERHAARRIDRQMAGRAGRQGDPGSSQCIVSLEDELLLQWLASATAILRKMYAGRSVQLPRRLRWVFDLAQRRAQLMAYRSRAAVVRHEDDLERTWPR